MTKAICVHELGGPEVLRLDEITLAPPGEGEVLVRNRAIGVNFIDTYFRSGLYKAPHMPFIPGHEAAGEIAAVGPGVKGWKAGDRVAYVAPLGGYAEERIVAADRLVSLPKSISYDTAAAMMLKGLTAQYLLRQTFKVKKGHRLLVHAAAGGVGLILCQWARSLGAHVIATVGSEAKARLAFKAGASDVIHYREENFAERVYEITKGKLCDVVYDGVGKATFPASLDCLKPFGLFVSFGSASGPIEAFDIGLLASKGSLFATRPTLNAYTTKPKRYAKMAKELFEVVEDGSVEIAVNQIAPLADAANMHKALEARETSGATVLVP
ncbi:quinone oxidoreductase family protein [Beijerinckia mobilis]|uniref:quinone oxidoreductase family protein n=1 Tax=Beijerinckia mobilis TaxID=231434 RepID=UPI000555EB66|nr:quinone oxidoreductase [Beijerinckia mobilis]